MDQSNRAFNQELNRSVPIREKFLRWQNYREDVKHFIEKGLEGYEGKSLLVLGAGECNDLDLKYLKQHFEEVVLSDIDEESIKRGMDYQEVDDKALKRLPIDYSGLDERGFFEGFLFKIKKGEPMEELCHYLRSNLDHRDNFRHQLTLKKPYDIILSTPVYTQLVLPQLQNILEMIYEYGLYSEEDLKELSDVLMVYLPKVIEGYNRFILDNVNGGGRVIVLADMIEDHSKSIYMKTILKDKKSGDNEMEKLHNDYVAEYGFGMSSYGIFNLQERARTLYSDWFVWPFTSERYFAVKGIVAQA